MRHAYRINYGDILLSPLDAETSELYRELRNRTEVCRWFAHTGKISKEQQQIWFQKYLNKEDDMMFSSHLSRAGEAFIGAVAIYDISLQNKTAEFGRIAVLPDMKGKGYGAKITRAVCKFAADELGLERLYLEVLMENMPAVKAYWNAGFRDVHAGEFRNKNRMIRMVNILA